MCIRDSGEAVASEPHGLFRQAEIQQLDSLLRNQNIGRLQIAVGDALAVRRV